MAATDLFTVEGWTLGEIVRYQLLFFMRFSTREVQIARNLTDCIDGDQRGQ